ncbi:MAG: sigma factor-like helix-turn-helix DNA-binding protein [Phycisphaerales bacterium]
MPSKKNNDNDGLRRRAARMTASLDPRDHAVLALRFGENLSVGETAAVLNMNPDEVRSAVNRAVGILHRTGTA